MKFFVCILAFALLYTASSLPINEQSTGASGSAATVPGDQKTESKSDVPSTPLAEEKLTESATKESSSPAPSSTLSTEERSSTPKEELIPQQQQQPLKPSVPSPAVSVEEPANKVPSVDIAKSEIGTKSAPLTAELVQKSDTKVEQVSSSSEQPKELNNQVNAVSVDEPKPVQNEVKSEIPKEETTKSEPAKEEMKAEKVEEKKEEKKDDNKPVPVLSGVEAKPAEKPALIEEVKKAAVASSEEKIDSQERDVSKEVEKKEPAKPDQSSESSEEKKVEKPVDGAKKEESSVKPQAESLPTEPSKLSTLVASAQPASEKLPEKSESEKDVIKREAAKDKLDEKKSTENFAKKDKIKSNLSVKEEVNKNTKPE